MHYRWSFLDREHASGHLVDEMFAGARLPRDDLRAVMVERQLGRIRHPRRRDRRTRGHVESTAMAAYDQLEAILEERPFLLGERRTIADFGFVGPMLRHFAQDPTPAELMRRRAPRLFTWVARMWEASPDPADAALIPSIDAPLSALIREACETHMIQLRDNAKGFSAGDSHFETTIQGCQYTALPVSRYRVWCLEELRREWSVLDAAARETTRSHLTDEATSLLSDPEPIARSDYDADREAPFNRAINVYGGRHPRVGTPGAVAELGVSGRRPAARVPPDRPPRGDRCRRLPRFHCPDSVACRASPWLARRTTSSPNRSARTSRAWFSCRLRGVACIARGSASPSRSPTPKSESWAAPPLSSTSPDTPTPSRRTGSASASSRRDFATCAMTSPSSVGSARVS